MKLLEVLNLKREAKYERGLKKSRSLRSIKDKQFESPKEKYGREIQG
jgi:hypothetical protein